MFILVGQIPMPKPGGNMYSSKQIMTIEELLDSHLCEMSTRSHKQILDYVGNNKMSQKNITFFSQIWNLYFSSIAKFCTLTLD